jgi:hypothetical protein
MAQAESDGGRWERLVAVRAQRRRLAVALTEAITEA